MPKKILVADDSPAIKSLAESLLRQQGYEVLSASNGKEAWELVKLSQPDLILLDHSMPEMDGEKVCENIKSDEKLKNIPVVVLLGTNEIRSQKRFEEKGADGFLIKPFTPKELLTQVEIFTSREIPVLRQKKVQSEQEKPKTQAHGYEWFLTEMKKEMDQVSRGESETPKKEVEIEKTDRIILEGERSKREPEFKVKELVSNQSGYENFISEFRKDVDKEEKSEPMVYSELKVEENLEETLGSDKIQEKVVKGVRKTERGEVDYQKLTGELIQKIAAEVAQKIVGMIDKKFLEEEIKKEIERIKTVSF